MQIILSIVVPIFALILLGYVLARRRVLPAQAGESLAAFVFTIAMPALFFRSLATARFSEANPVLLWISYFAGVAVVFALAAVIVRRVGKADRRASVVAGISASFSNAVFVGLPMTERAFDQPGLDVLFLILAVHMPTMMTVSTLLVERAAHADAREAEGPGQPAPRALDVIRRVGRNLLGNALILGIFAGLLWRLTGLPIAGPADDILRLLADTAAPLALVSLGMTLARLGVRGDLAIPAFVTVLALLVQPLVVLAVGSLFLPPLWLGVAVLIAACPSGVNGYLFASQFRSGEKLAAATILLTTVVSAATLTGWLLLMT